jgi:hypothetical protein
MRLSTDAPFPFDRGDVSDILPGGRADTCSAELTTLSPLPPRVAARASLLACRHSPLRPGRAFARATGRRRSTEAR